MRRDLWLKQWCTGCCRKIHPISILSHTKTRFRHSDHPDAYIQPYSDLQMQAHTCTQHLPRFCPHAELFYFWIQFPLLTLLERAVKTIVSAPAVAQKWALSSGLKAAGKQKGLILSLHSQACQHSGEEEYGSEIQLWSSEASAQKSCLTWNCHQIYLLSCSCWMSRFLC